MSYIESDRNNKIFAGLGLTTLSIVILMTVLATPTKSTITMMNTASSSVSSPRSSSQVASSVNKSGNSHYKDGNYTAVGKYYSPGGQESVKVSLDLKNDIITNSAVESGANDPTAISYQTIFITNYKKYVEGKKINTIKVSNVSGSSLTSQGFANALKQIEN